MLYTFTDKRNKLVLAIVLMIFVRCFKVGAIFVFIIQFLLDVPYKLFFLGFYDWQLVYANARDMHLLM
jgi:hypothetical protein